MEEEEPGLQVAPGVRICLKAEQRPGSSQVVLVLFWAAEVEELFRGSLAWRRVRVP